MRHEKRVVTLLLAVPLLLIGCSTPQARDDSPPVEPSTASPNLGTISPETWCSVKVGDSRDQIVRLLGEPNGEPAESESLIEGFEGAEALRWEDGGEIYAALLVDGQVSSLTMGSTSEVAPEMPCATTRP
ncbi:MULTISPECIES: hypothetical protein [unclassified Nocardioides]|uniref:hypothetical protein n=1 Tax=unclassified Nocardioides TaxID=2615069 RepID=UPI0030145511